MLDIIVGITNPELAATRALPSIPSNKQWLSQYTIRNAGSLYDLRKQSCFTGVSEWVTFLDQGDELFCVDRYKEAIAGASTGAVFANSIAIYPSYEVRQFPRNFTYFGKSTLLSGVVPHKPLIMRRDVARDAIDSAYERIVKSDDKFKELIDLAIVFEIALKGGWTYYPMPVYKWYSAESKTHHADPAVVLARTEMLNFYRRFIG